MNTTKTGGKSLDLRRSLEKIGLRISTCSVLGKYVHIGVSNKDDYDGAIDAITSGLKPEKIIHLAPGADGKHLDGTKDHRFCAVLGK